MTPVGHGPALCGTGNTVRVAPNYAAGLVGGGLSQADLEAIRGTVGVEVAAPIGLVGKIDGLAKELWLVGGLPASAEAFHIQTTITMDDGAQRVPVSQLSRAFALDGSAGASVNMGILTAESGSQTLQVADGVLGVFPPTSQVVIAVDPVAERALLRASDGEFLEPLVTAGTLGDRRRDHLAAEWYEGLVKESAIALSDGDDSDVIVPLVINTDPQFAFDARLESRAVDLAGVGPLWSHTGIESQDEPPQASAELERRLATTAPGELLAAETHDFAAEFAPFAERESSITASWLPPPELPAGQGFASATVARVVPAEVNFSPRGKPNDVDCAMQAEPVGPPTELHWLLPDQDPHADFQFGESGLTLQNYRGQTTLQEGMEGLEPTIIGYYSSGSVDSGVDTASYVPLGAYEVGSTAILGPDPHADIAAASTLRPAVNALGVTTASPGAITDLEGARALTGRDAIDAVRVRVADVRGYDAVGRAKVAAVAEALAAQGFDVNTVAGSSREHTLIYVPGYFVDHHSEQTGDLGWVSQEWSAVGAAARVEAGLDAVGRMLLWLTLAVTCALSTVTMMHAGLGRRSEVRTLMVIGWERRAIRSWLSAELAIGAAVLLGFVGWAVAWGRPRGADSMAFGVSLGAVLLTYGLASYLMVRLATGTAGSQVRPRRRAIGSMTSMSIALRRLRQEKLATAATTVGLVAVGGSAAGAAGALLSARPQVGGSRLADLLTDSLLPLHLGLVGVGLLAALALLNLGWRLQDRSRRQSTSTLLASGWSQQQLRRLRLVELLVVGAVGAIGAAGLGLGVAAGAAVGLLGPSLLAALVSVMASLGTLLKHPRRVAP